LSKKSKRNQGDYSTPVSTIVNLTDLTASLYQIAENSPRAYAAGSSAYYGPGTGSFEVRLSAEDPSPGSGQASGLAVCRRGSCGGIPPTILRKINQ
jgi:hypothetical protein